MNDVREEQVQITPEQQERLRRVSSGIMQALGENDYAIVALDGLGANIVVSRQKMADIMAGKGTLQDAAMAFSMATMLVVQTHDQIIEFLKVKHPEDLAEPLAGPSKPKLIVVPG